MKKTLASALIAVCSLCVSWDPASRAISLSPVVNAENAALDFTLVNKTGYKIKGLYIGVASNADWDETDEVLKGRTFADGASIEIKFHPKATSQKWDIMVEWADGSSNDSWHNVKLTEISKVTLTYSREKNETYASAE